MTQPIERDSIYRGRRFQTETIELCVRWYITCRLSYRDLAAVMTERGSAFKANQRMKRALELGLKCGCTGRGLLAVGQRCRRTKTARSGSCCG